MKLENNLRACSPADLKSKNRFAIVIPVYNHGTCLEDVIIRAQKLNLPVIAVDDGSTDDTPRLLSGFTDISVITHRTNKGKGAAIKTGLKAACRIADWALTMDADGQHNPADATALIRQAHNSGRGLIIGCRTGMNHPNVKWTSRMGRRFSNFWVKTCGGPLVSDSQSGFRAYPLPEVIDFNIAANHFDFEVEVLVQARRHGLKVTEVPVGVTYMPPEKRISHFRPWRDFLRNARTFSRLLGIRFSDFLRHAAKTGRN
jgi:glycosyltransferase involved in cell wall biosynthesis